MDEPKNALITRMNALTASIDNNSKTVSSLAAKVRRGRRVIALLAVSVIFSFILSVGLGYALYKVDATQDKIHDVSVELCESRNDQAAGNRNLWANIVGYASDSDTPPDPETLADFNKLLDETFVQLDCKP